MLRLYLIYLYGYFDKWERIYKGIGDCTNQVKRKIKYSDKSLKALLAYCLSGTLLVTIFLPIKQTLPCENTFQILQKSFIHQLKEFPPVL